MTNRSSSSIRVAWMLIVVLAGQLSWMPISEAQEPKRIAVILVAFPPDRGDAQALRQGLNEAGYVEGRDIVLDWRWAEGDHARVPTVVADALKTHPDLLVVESTIAIRAAKEATSTIPIVMAVAADPVGSGLVESLARPGGNITGLSMMIVDLGNKRLQLLKQTLPGLKRLGVLHDPSLDWHAKAVGELTASARSIGMETVAASVQRPTEFEDAFATLRQGRVQALYILDNAFFTVHRAVLLKLANQARLPVAYGSKLWVDSGALLSYSANFADMFRRSAGYVDKVLKGAKPGELPIEQPTKFQLVVNLKAAKALGLKIPESILLQADEVIR